MKTKTISLSFLFILILSSLTLVHAQLGTNLSVTSDKTIYNLYDHINLSGTLQANGISPSDGLVGIQVLYPSGGASVVLRTIQTGTTQGFNQAEKITSAYSSDASGTVHVSSFQNGANGYFTAVVTNQDNQLHNALVAISIYDGNGMPLGLATAAISIGTGASQPETLSIPIPTTAHSGTSYGYANVYTDWPKNGGVPLAQEQPFQFTISGGAPAFGSAPTNSGNAGSYSMTFTLPKNTQKGNYQVYASSEYSGLFGTASTTFSVPGWFGDFNADGTVDSNDFFIFLNAYILYYQGQNYNTACDLNHDGKIDANDFFLFLGDYIQYWSA
jgi:hypothetical protein